MDKHYSDEELLSDLDGEISKQKRKGISRHLEFCWPCRARRAELEGQIQAISALVQRVPVDSNWNRRARENLTLFQAEFEKEVVSSRRFALLRPVIWGPAAAVASCCVAIAFFMLRVPSPAIPSARAVLNKTEIAAATMAREPIHQVFQMKEVQIEPKGPTQESHLEIWSDGQSNRFASKWTAADGRLKHAIWSTNDKAFVYESNKLQPFSRAHQRPQQLAAFNGAEPDISNLERQFISWLEERPWKPIVLLADIGLWRSEGSTLRVERLSARELRLTVDRKAGNVELAFVVVIQADNPIPKIQKLWLRTADRAVELELFAEKTDAKPVFSAAVFHPDAGLSVVRASRHISERLPISEPPEGDRNYVLPVQDMNSVLRTLQAHYVLHLAGACGGAPVTVSQEGGGVRVSASEGSDSKSYFTVASSLEDVMNTLAAIRTVASSASEPPGQSTTEMAALVTNADALKLLATDFDASKTRAMPLPALALLERMVGDHTMGFRRNLKELLARSATGPSSQTKESPFAPAVADWRNDALMLAQISRSSENGGFSDIEPPTSELTWLTEDLDRSFAQEIATDKRYASLREMEEGVR